MNAVWKEQGNQNLFPLPSFLMTRTTGENVSSSDNSICAQKKLPSVYFEPKSELIVPTKFGCKCSSKTILLKLWLYFIWTRY